MSVCSGLEKVRDSTAEDQEHSERSTEWQSSIKGYGGSNDFYCDSQGLEDFPTGRTEMYIQCNQGIKSSIEGS